MDTGRDGTVVTGATRHSAIHFTGSYVVCGPLTI